MLLILNFAFRNLSTALRKIFNVLNSDVEFSPFVVYRNARNFFGEIKSLSV